MASSSAAKSIIRDGKLAMSLILRVRSINVAETAKSIGPARSLLRFNQTPESQYSVFSDSLQILQPELRIWEMKTERIEVRHGKKVVNNESGEDTDEEDEDSSDFDEDFDDVDLDGDDFDDDEEDDEEEKFTKKRK